MIFPSGLGLMLIYYEVECDLANPIRLSEEHTEAVWVSKENFEQIENDPNIDIHQGPLEVLEKVLGIGS